MISSSQCINIILDWIIAWNKIDKYNIRETNSIFSHAYMGKEVFYQHIDNTKMEKVSIPTSTICIVSWT